MVKGKRITVLGGGLSGRAAATLARDRGAMVVLSDIDPDCPHLEGVENCMGGHPDRILETDILVVSPGIPATISPVQNAREYGAEITGELGFAARFLDSKTPVVAITGTNGKSTVTAFTGQLFEAAGWKTFAGGNLGRPLSEAVGEYWDVLVVEVSSYQMELPGSFSPNVSVVLNLTPDHLERHGSMENYAGHKFKLLQITRLDGEVVLPKSNEELDLLALTIGRDIHRMDTPSGFVLEGDIARMLGVDIDLSDLALAGSLNRKNAATACFLAQLAGLPHADLRPNLLRALPHRMEGLSVEGELLWFNDSKATNVEATLAGVSGMEEPICLLLGGQGKAGADYGALRALFDGPVVRVIAFGQAGPSIAQAMEGLCCTLVETLADAVVEAVSLTQPGASVVLSPACASFDEFDNFTHRGQAFQSLVETRLGDVALGRNG
jgi:UDP-N-acetylmuramoylalanine--D-glutamate ligase